MKNWVAVRVMNKPRRMSALITREPGRATQEDFGFLPEGLVDFSRRVQELESASAVLNELHAVTTQCLPLFVLGAARFPLKSRDWDSVHFGKSIFVHAGAPEGWWEEYETVARGRFRPLLFLARNGLASYT